jgi:hypothetical protein
MRYDDDSDSDLDTAANAAQDTAAAAAPTAAASALLPVGEECWTDWRALKCVSALALSVAIAPLAVINFTLAVLTAAVVVPLIVPLTPTTTHVTILPASAAAAAVTASGAASTAASDSAPAVTTRVGCGWLWLRRVMVWVWLLLFSPLSLALVGAGLSGRSVAHVLAAYLDLAVSSDSSQQHVSLLFVVIGLVYVPLYAVACLIGCASRRVTLSRPPSLTPAPAPAPAPGDAHLKTD